MRKILIITSSPKTNGSGDILASAVEKAAVDNGAVVRRVALRDLNIAPFSFQQADDDFTEVMAQMRDADGIAVTVPIYFNMPCAQAVTLLNRCFCIFQPDYVSSGKTKKLAILETCGHGDPEKIRTMTEDAVGFFHMVTECRIEVFSLLSDPAEKAIDPDNVRRAAELGAWLAQWKTIGT